MIEVRTGEEVLATITAQAKELGIETAAIVSLIGAVGSASISNMPPHDASQDIVTDYEQPMELSGTGEITGGVTHVHVVLSTQDDRTFAGHLHAATVDTFFVRAYLQAL